MRKTIPIIVALAAAMTMGSAFAEQKGQSKGDLGKVDRNKPAIWVEDTKMNHNKPGETARGDAATGQSSGKRQHLPVTK